MFNVLDIFQNFPGDIFKTKSGPASAQKKRMDVQDLWLIIKHQRHLSDLLVAGLHWTTVFISSPTPFTIFSPTLFTQWSLLVCPWRNYHHSDEEVRISSPYSIDSFPERWKYWGLFSDCIIHPIKFPNIFSPEIWYFCKSVFAVLNSNASFFCYRGFCTMEGVKKKKKIATTVNTKAMPQVISQIP